MVLAYWLNVSFVGNVGAIPRRDDYTREVEESFKDEKKYRVETYTGANWSYIRKTINNNFNNFSKDLFTVNGKEVKLKVSSKKRISLALKERLGLDIKLK